MHYLTNKTFRIALATKNGAYFLSPDEARKNWKLGGPILPGENLNKIIEDGNGNLFAASFDEGIFKSTDGGRTWKQSSKGLIVRKVWELAAKPNQKGTVYAGTQYGHLFRSTNYGENWEEVTSLHEAPNRREWGIDWGYRTTGLALHTIRFDVNRPDMIYLVAAGNGTYRSDDGGETWKSIKAGTDRSCNIEPEKLISSAPPDASPEEKLARHLEELHSDTHKIIVSQKDGKIFQQNHCGTFFSSNNGDLWKDISIDRTNRFGFSIDVIENDSTHVFTIPVPDVDNECRAHNVCIRGQLAIYSTSDYGKIWKRHTNGLPDNVHTNVLRDSIAHDNTKDPGLYFGTTTGDVYFSGDLGNSWRSIASGIGRIQGLNVIEP